MSSQATTPTAPALVSSETLTVMTFPTPQNVHSKDYVTDSESDTEEEDDVSENDLEILSEQSNTVDTTGNTQRVFLSTYMMSMSLTTSQTWISSRRCIRVNVWVLDTKHLPHVV